MQSEKRGVVDILLPMLISLTHTDRKLDCHRWISLLRLSVTVSPRLFVSPWHCICLSISLPLCLALPSQRPLHLSLPCHWAMCAVPVSKTAGRLSSFPRWRMRGRRGSCESYRLGSVKVLPPWGSCCRRRLPSWSASILSFTLKMAT